MQHLAHQLHQIVFGVAKKVIHKSCRPSWSPTACSAAMHLFAVCASRTSQPAKVLTRLSALSVLVLAGPKTLDELAAAEQVRPPAMSRIVAGLARSRLVEITADSNDARRMHIRATPKGTRPLQKGRRLRIESVAARLNALSPQELVKLGEAVEIFQTILAAWR
jgi:DNA-binding MarR family transcriptional regulator